MARTRSFALILFLLSALLGAAYAIDEADLLPQEQAYPLATRVDGDGRVLLIWDIADGYYLYRSKFKFVSKTAGVAAGEAMFPAGTKKHDEFFGEMEIYRGHLEIPLALRRDDPSVRKLDLELTSQGCADIGICYPPHKQVVALELPRASVQKDAPAASANPLAKLIGGNPKTGVQQDDLLPPDQAFHFIAEVKDGQTLRVSWQIADGYYLYRERFKFAMADTVGAELGAFEIPRGKVKQEEEGPMEVFYREVGFDLPLVRTGTGPLTIHLQARYQGCAAKGVCYPPIEKTAALDLPPLPAGSSPAVAGKGDVDLSEQDRIAAALKTDSTWLVVVSFLGFGLLMAFTPCIFPMIPILSGIIVGQGHAISTGRAFLLSLSYVLAASLAYTVFGVLAGLFGGNLQAVFQEPAIIGLFSALFVLLALSMFGLYELHVPHFIQDRVAVLSHKQKGGTLLGAAVMGALSALIVGPCMAAPLAGALIYIGQTGDAALGGVALFALGFGMGIPLLIIGASAGKLLPKAGAWMNAVKSVFGVGMLAVAVGLLERVVPAALSM
ncbi:MAG: thiol:disulfide interchange protein, partial [Proteobacteria bacterium]|nr:thiol:disulfide interchange protein [Pseudomonadota bacterium]